MEQEVLVKVWLAARHAGVAEWASLAGLQSLVVALPHSGNSPEFLTGSGVEKDTFPRSPPGKILSLC